MGCGNSSKNSENAEIETMTEPVKKLKVACVGDSITEGFGLNDPRMESYPAQLAARFQKEGEWQVENFGLRNKTLLKNGDDPYANTSKFWQSHEYNPNIVILMLGTNDVKDQNWVKIEDFEKDYTELISSYANLPSKPTIYICYPPPIYDNPYSLSSERIKELKQKIENIASTNSVDIIDIYSVLTNKEGFFSDGVHPNRDGAKVIANTVYEKIY
jgi:lysophospholipase L1-like esterase